MKGAKMNEIKIREGKVSLDGQELKNSYGIRNKKHNRGRLCRSEINLTC